MNFRKKGEIGEDTAVQYLKSLKKHIIERNYYSPFGEIDIIVEEDRTIVFIEVKYRESRRMGKPAESVDFRKKRRIVLSARHYMMKHPRLAQHNIRFDFIGIDTEREPPVQYIRDIIADSEF
ncbi:MAG: YraN family protein [candidate division WOR-3 bacterium]|nr:YraN family protein [candidate division WOR-3 bacterium]